MPYKKNQLRYGRKELKSQQQLLQLPLKATDPKTPNYIYRKKQLREIDRRIRYLQKRLPDLKTVNRVGDESKIYFGARVSLELEDGNVVKYRIVGADEIDSDSRKGYISVDSPLARALLTKQVDDELSISVTGQKREYIIKQILYE